MKTIFRAWFFRLIKAVLFLAVFCSFAHAQNGALGQFLRNAQGGTVKAMMEGGSGFTGRYTATFPAQDGKLLLIDTTTGITNLLQSGTAPELRFYNSTGNFYSGFKAATLTANTTFTWPSSAGNSGQVLTSNGSGVLNWTTPNVSFWGLAGNTATNATTDFLGTTDANPLSFRTTNAERMRIAATGNVGIGNTNPAEKLDITGNLRFSGALMPNGQPGTLGYVLFSMGANAAPVWVDGGGYLNGMSWQLNGNNINALKTFGTINNYALPFMTNNTERMRITEAGNIGIGTTNPAELLDVAGNIKISGGNKRLLFDGMPGDVDHDAVIGLRNTAVNEQQEMLFFIGNDNEAAYGPDRIRMVAEEFRLQTFNNAANSTLANAESETGTNTRLLVNTEGNVAIGSTAFTSGNAEKLLVDAGTTASYNVIGAKGTINNYLQMNIQNRSAGNAASTDIVATADNGSETTNYIDMGINGSGYTGGYFGGANDAYIYNLGQDLLIGTGTAAKSLKFMTGGSSETLNTRMTIDGNGNVGIGTAPTTDKLTVAGSIVPTSNGAFNLGSSTNKWSQVYATSGYVNSSDRRLKTNIHALPYGLKEVMQMEPVRYNWKDTTNKETKLGLIAQDVKTLIPEVVTGNEAKETLGIYYSDLVPVLINAIKEQQAQIEDLKKEISNLKKNN